MKKNENRLAKEKSPYLLQHANNPVDWYPWGDEAFQKARKEDKPVFLSIGYSTCHWCHVMEKESFEDEEISRLMNDSFINIKVDREERPDIDNLYMNVCNLLTGSGGWPLTVLLTPDKKPFFAGTYFPKESMMGRPGMKELIPKIMEVWVHKRDDVLESAEGITSKIKVELQDNSGALIDKSSLTQAFEQLESSYDSNYGGFSNAPKFPVVQNILFLLRYWKRTGNGEALIMAENTLEMMRKGGIYDHAGYGFHRYSTDEKWLVPHFEKMLYDQAMLMLGFTEAYQATKNPLFKKTIEEIFTYVKRNLTSPQNAFYSAEDADSEGIEGKFYFWTVDEIQNLVSDFDLFSKVFPVMEEGNFASELPGGQNILFMAKNINEIAEELNIESGELENFVYDNLNILFEYRQQRIKPFLDDKILADWNGLMIAALAKAGAVLNNFEMLESAGKAAAFILDNMLIEGDTLLHRYRDGEAGIPGMLDDYSFFIFGLLELYQVSFDVYYLREALRLIDKTKDLLWDSENGAYYLSPSTETGLLTRDKAFYDGAIPSGNSVMLMNLLRLAHITDNKELYKYADRLAKAYTKGVKTMPSGFLYFLCGFDYMEGNTVEVVISGDKDSTGTQILFDELNEHYLPSSVVIFRPDEENPKITEFAKFTKEQKPINGKPAAYVCENYNCKQPVTDPRILETDSKK